MPSEFQLISQYFGRQSHHDGVMLGIGDDAALLQVPTGEVLVATTDTFISGRHFPENTHPFAIGHKALAVNLSDLAAMGATPRWFLLARPCLIVMSYFSVSFLVAYLTWLKIAASP